MHNELFSIGPLHFHMYGLMTAVGIICAYLVLVFRSGKAKRKGFHQEDIIKLIIFCLVFGYLGSKILYLLTILPQIIEDPSLILRSITDGWVIFGGILGGMFGGWLFCKLSHRDAGVYFDMAFPSVALAQGFGRLGCFFAGCCYGMPTTGPIAIVFKNSDYAPNNVPLVPT
ncbi:MAG: prolipoprotein diacylglyceryl transferase, partial [Eubacterium sp.]|nr:prolipoprotein diacylglyceryl transferase [Eubacterium sp.]